MWDAMQGQLAGMLESIKHTFLAWNVLDWCVIAGLLCCLLWGALRGLRSQALSLFGYIVAFIVAAKNAEYFTPWVRKRIFPEAPSGLTSTFSFERGEGSAPYALHGIIAFCLLFLFVLLGLWLLKHLLTKMSSVRPIRRLDRYGGAVLGCLHFIGLWSVVYVLLLAWPSGELRLLATESYWMNKSEEWIPIWFAEAVQWVQWF